MIAILAAALAFGTPFNMNGAEPELQEIAYDFRFAVMAAEAQDATDERLHKEASRYCRAKTREAGMPEQASLCTQVVVERVKDALADRASGQYAQR